MAPYPSDPYAQILVGLVVDLLYPSETDAPFEVEEVPNGPTSRCLRAGVGVDEDVPIEVLTLEEWLGPIAKHEQENVGAPVRPSFRLLKRFLEGHVLGATVYRVGTTDVRYELWGQLETSKTWVRLTTRAVET